MEARKNALTETAMLVLNPLSDAEIDEVCRQPLVTKEQTFARAQARFAHLRKREWFILERLGRWLAIDAVSLACAVGSTQDEALNKHFGPTGPGGRHFLCLAL